MWRKARKKPVIVEFREPVPDPNYMNAELIHTREGNLFAFSGEDFVIRGVKGELYPIKKDIFYETYEVLE